MTPELAVLLARYNQRMNAQLGNAASTLSNDALMQDRQAFFGSIFLTLQHLLVTDLIWLNRLSAHPGAQVLREGLASQPWPTSLRQVLTTDGPDLQDRRSVLDALILRWVQGLIQQDLDDVLAYYNMAGEPHCKRLGDLLAHLFNHQTHHRGQASTLLVQAGVAVGVTDLLLELPER